MKPYQMGIFGLMWTVTIALCMVGALMCLTIILIPIGLPMFLLGGALGAFMILWTIVRIILEAVRIFRPIK